MKSLFLCLFLSGVLSTPLYAQSDSLSVVKADWKKQKITRGVTLKTYWFNQSLFNSNQNVSVLEVRPKKNIMLDLAYEVKNNKPTSTFGKSANAIAAVNGTFFDIANGGSVYLTKADGVIINDLGGERSPRQRASLVFNDGWISIQKWNGDPSWDKTIEAEDIMASGPMLILDNRDEILDSAAFNSARHPRTAVAITKNKRVLLITVDGRNENSAGMSLFELMKLMRWLNAEDAINLDGGGSTTLWINGFPGNGIVNYPSDNKKWDHEGERNVANAVLVRKTR